MKIDLSSVEARIIGCLLEKQVTTPEQYPLSLNALVSACNQKSNRDPVMELDETEVQNALDQLVKKYLVAEKTGFGSRVSKFVHRFCNTEFGDLKFSPQSLSIVCVLLLRGAQTPGELRTRTARLFGFKDVNEVEAELQQLAIREDGPFAVKLPREAGRREARWMHLFSGDVTVADEYGKVESNAKKNNTAEFGLQTLEQKLDSMQRQLKDLQTRIEILESRK